ncbi:MAG: hypothetical protein RLZZ292_1009 [Bacteroidota bacterium]|jgi:type IX secretion system PorP/SprF family membrane protein
MKKNILSLYVFLAFVGTLQAQQYPLFSNYIMNCFGYNPAVAAMSECVSVKATHRSQWTGIAEAPQTSIVSVHAKMKNSPIGIGGYAYSDKGGTMKRSGASVALCYSMKLDSFSYFGIGATGGYYQISLASDHISGSPTDVALANAVVGKGIPDFNAGIYYRRKGFWLGFSVPQVLERKIDFLQAGKMTSRLSRHYYGMVGYEIKASEKFRLEPSALIKYVESAPVQVDANLKLTFANSFWLAGGYRMDTKKDKDGKSGDAIVGMIGVDINNRLNLAYAYDMVANGLNSASKGSHEIGVGLNLCKSTDRDGDGVPDDKDKCPDKPGPKDNDGCPPGEHPDKADRDKDGILDKDDKCPDVPGKKEFDGCPEDPKKDTDGDGVPDNEDQCPNQAGLKENRGCPFLDRDGDGLRDDVDKCPEVAGVVENMGCPLKDRDRDGIVDDKDPCPDEAGTLEDMGCPPGKRPSVAGSDGKKVYMPQGVNGRPGDMDGDGIPDELDNCPYTYGKTKTGCPSDETANNLLQIAIHNIYYDYDKAEIRQESFKYLDGLADWMKAHPEYKIKMAGHTDVRGREEYNLELSKNRIYAVFYYLTDRGVVPPDRISIAWYGENRPICTQKTEQCHQQNRRVEMQWRFD